MKNHQSAINFNEFIAKKQKNWLTLPSSSLVTPGDSELDANKQWNGWKAAGNKLEKQLKVC